LIVGHAFAVLWQYQFRQTSLPAWRPTIAIVFFVLADVLSWTATRVLGKQWRVDAGLNAEHEPVTAGRYRLVRHSIYTSILSDEEAPNQIRSARRHNDGPPREKQECSGSYQL